MRLLQCILCVHLSPVRGALGMARNCIIPLTLVVLGTYCNVRLSKEEGEERRPPTVDDGRGGQEQVAASSATPHTAELHAPKRVNPPLSWCWTIKVFVVANVVADQFAAGADAGPGSPFFDARGCVVDDAGGVGRRA
jgi:hypothetical protein